MDIVLSFDSSTSSAPSGFDAAVRAAASYLDTLIVNSITVHIDVGWNEVGGNPLTSGAVAAGGPAMATLSYSQVRTALYNARDSVATDTAWANLPASDPSGGRGFSVSTAQEKAWGLISANLGQTDGVVGFSSAYSYDFSTTGTVPSGELDFNGVALHELTHALGRVSDFGTSLTTPSVLDLFRYTGAGTLATSASQTAYFSYDGGVTNLDYYSTSGDPGDWAQSAGADSFDAYSVTGQRNVMTQTDITEMNVLGFAVSNCFATGTHITTLEGERPVETLRPGDHVCLADGGTAEVRWVGRQTIAARFADPLRTWPVRIRAGALAEGVPRRDLLLSPGHAVRIGAMLANAAALVNGGSVRRETRVPGQFTYWHVELDDHALLLAEGAAAESYLHDAAEFRFDNAAERPAGAGTALPLPRCKSPRQVPPAIRAALAQRETAMASAA